MVGLEHACKIYYIDQKKVAERLEIAPPNVSAWIKGNRNIPYKYLADLSKIFYGLDSRLIEKEVTEIEKIKIEIFFLENVSNVDEQKEKLPELYNTLDHLEKIKKIADFVETQDKNSTALVMEVMEYCTSKDKKEIELFPNEKKKKFFDGLSALLKENNL